MRRLLNLSLHKKTLSQLVEHVNYPLVTLTLFIIHICSTNFVLSICSRTKRSINRDKYSGTFEEQQYEENMVAQKQQYNQNQNQMTLSAMTSSMQSER